MLATISYSHKLLQKLSQLRNENTVPYLRPDAKSQVTAEYKNGKLSRIDAVVISTQHSEDVEHKTLEDMVIKDVVKEVIPAELLDENTKYHINPTGRFVIGGPQGDCGRLDVRSLLIPTVVTELTVVVPFQEKIQQRLIGRQRIWEDISQKILLQLT